MAIFPHVGGCDQHQVRKLVNDDDDIGKFFRNDDVLVTRHDDHSSSTSTARKPSAPGSTFSFFAMSGNSGSQAGGANLSLGRSFEGFDVADIDPRENLVARFFHLVDDPAQGKQDFFWDPSRPARRDGAGRCIAEARATFGSKIITKRS